MCEYLLGNLVVLNVILGFAKGIDLIPSVQGILPRFTRQNDTSSAVDCSTQMIPIRFKHLLACLQSYSMNFRQEKNYK